MIRCKGRNGMFNFHHADIINMQHRDESFVDIYSGQTYGKAPIAFHGETDELIDLFRMIIGELEKKEVK